MEDFDSMKVVQLKTHCKANSLSQYGRKSELIGRLKVHFQSQQPPQVQEEAESPIASAQEEPTTPTHSAQQEDAATSTISAQVDFNESFNFLPLEQPMTSSQVNDLNLNTFINDIIQIEQNLGNSSHIARTDTTQRLIYQSDDEEEEATLTAEMPKKRKRTTAQ